MIQVGARYKLGKNRYRKYSYKDVKYQNGWADASLFLPVEGDLVLMDLDDGRKMTGWINGTTWYSRKLKKDDIVRYWKRTRQEEQPQDRYAP